MDLDAEVELAYKIGAVPEGEIDFARRTDEAGAKLSEHKLISCPLCAPWYDRVNIELTPSDCQNRKKLEAQWRNMQ